MCLNKSRHFNSAHHALGTDFRKKKENILKTWEKLPKGKYKTQKP